MKRAGRFLVRVALTFVSLVLGALLLSVLTYLFHLLVFPGAIGDGQYGMVFIVIVPLGAVQGWMTAALIARRVRREREGALRIANGSLGLAGALAFTGWFGCSGTGDPNPIERLVATIFWFGVPLVWSGLLFLLGRREPRCR